MSYDPNCAWYDFSCTSNPSGCAWYDFLCTAANDTNKVVQPILTKLIIIIAIVAALIAVVAFSPLGKRVPLPRLG